MAKLAIKSETSKSNSLFPIYLSDLIPQTHIVRVVDRVIDELSLSKIYDTYKGGGNSAFCPCTMLKVWVYAYLCNIYSCRKVEQALKENINFMWLSGMTRPDYRTLNWFRGKRLKPHFDEIFTQVVLLLSAQGFVSLKVQYVDGTKLESCANKYTFVWRGSVEKSDAKLKARVAALLEKIEKENDLSSDEMPSPEDMSVEDFENRLSKIKSSIAEEKRTKQENKQIKEIEQKSLPKMKEHKEQLEKMGNRNSYSKTDEEATFMRMKEDAMLNGQLKPGYNMQMSTENQFITHYMAFPNPTDYLTFITYENAFEKRYQTRSDEITADSGYGSEQNYAYCAEHDIVAFVKYPMFHKEQKKAFSQNPFLQNNLYYNDEEDYYVCPMGQHMDKVREEIRVSDGGYRSVVSVYRAKNCEGCPLRCLCHKSKSDRQIEVNHQLNYYRSQAKELLTSEEGLKRRSRRPIEPEAVFGQLKANGMFRRMRLRGMAGVNLEFGLKAMAHNIKKMAQKAS